MTAHDGYRDGTALWSAVTAHATSASATTGVDRSAVIRRFVFSRLLARVFHDSSSPWVLKGGTAVLAEFTVSNRHGLKQISTDCAVQTRVRALAAAVGPRA